MSKKTARVPSILAIAAAGAAGSALGVIGASPALVLSPQVWRARASTDPVATIDLASTAVLWIIVAYLGLATLIALAGQLPGALGRRAEGLAGIVTPLLIRRGIHLLIGSTLGIGGLGGLVGADAAWATPQGSTASVHAGVREMLPLRPHFGSPSPVEPLPQLGEPAGRRRVTSSSSPLPELAPSSAPTPESTRPDLPSEPPATASGLPTVAPSPLAAADQSTRTLQAHPLPLTHSPPPVKQPPRQHRADGPAPGEPAPKPTAASTVTVQPGDCLWTLAAAELGPHPSLADVAAAWPRWWSANRAVIGPDPNVLLPGEHLRRPAGATVATSKPAPPSSARSTS